MGPLSGDVGLKLTHASASTRGLSDNRIDVREPILLLLIYFIVGVALYDLWIARLFTRVTLCCTLGFLFPPVLATHLAIGEHIGLPLGLCALTFLALITSPKSRGSKSE